MKKILFILLATMLLQSCTSVYYQVYRVEAEDMACNDDAIVYEDDNCSIIYNLWGESGNLSFVFMNKTDKDINIDLTRSFFIKNGMAYDYFEDKSYTSTKTSGYSSTSEIAESYAVYASKTASISKYGYTHRPYLWTPTKVGVSATVGAVVSGSSKKGSIVTNTNSESVTINPVRSICVPAHSAKTVKGFGISDYVYLECDNNKFNYPKKESAAIDYDKDSSPLCFRNKLVYSINNKDYDIDNYFWVSSVKNYNKLTFFKSKYIKECGKRFETRKYSPVISGVNLFYNRYRH